MQDYFDKDNIHDQQVQFSEREKAGKGIRPDLNLNQDKRERVGEGHAAQSIQHVPSFVGCGG